ncbi:hypothetical protein GMDG_00686 [Pseudogymnoascus destructans 20631-21]|uniref:Uncharacterized protein n=1 Tax=Pseudogymnoascus destructans (strain ATCC MYA-4855 / 20631-21) TaxID=658429 RepID=L8G9F9_PSED2|nr:hypothetical protein GMDG_00686 [Pseudogymnoascus destructans 20631-21]
MKGLIPREDVLNVRKHYFQNWADTALLEPGTSPQEGIFNSSENPLHHGGIGAGDLPLSEKEVETLISSHHLDSYLHFLDNPTLRQMVRDIMDWKKELLLRRTMFDYIVWKPKQPIPTTLHHPPPDTNPPQSPSRAGESGCAKGEVVFDGAAEGDGVGEVD